VADKNENKSSVIIEADELRQRLERGRDNIIKSYILNNFASEITPLGEFIDGLEGDIIKYALLISEDNQKKAAFLLGLKPPTLCEKMKRYNIKLDSELRHTALPFLRSIEEIGKLMDTPEEEL